MKKWWILLLLVPLLVSCTVAGFDSPEAAISAAATGCSKGSHPGSKFTAGKWDDRCVADYPADRVNSVTHTWLDRVCDASSCTEWFEVVPRDYQEGQESIARSQKEGRLESLHVLKDNVKDYIQ
ncbi:hypothetical protein A3A69_00815 [candidate division WWE3 bacterium RIFCSPLOWO2_01_FULL_37_15]|uniref:Lipoprotein n=1 Tax=candidate division WWE3 bacterium RIFCSPLOWO2_01_FULL_37_15 TaxID=1802622 RepID=A0A1F4UTA1_UNCKA|nr:MAG: hypothetical protein A3A69_00815 [candidate division WWE3 bacterium RIFCSPLOWO2_01_FULL_37_15]